MHRWDNEVWNGEERNADVGNKMRSRGLSHQLEVEDGGRDGEEGGVEAVEHTAVAGEDASRILDAELAFEETFHKVAPRAEDAHHQRQSEPLPEQEDGEGPPEHHTGEQAEQAATDGADPRLFGRDALKEAGGKAATEQAAAEVGTGVARPKEDEHAQRQHPRIGEAVGERIVAIGQEEDERKWEGDVELCGKGKGPVFQGIAFAAIEFADEEIENSADEREEKLVGRGEGAALPEGEDERKGTGGGDELIDRCTDVAVDQAGELPHGEGGNGGNEEGKGDGPAQHPAHEEGDVEHPGEGADEHIVHEDWENDVSEKRAENARSSQKKLM